MKKVFSLIIITSFIVSSCSTKEDISNTSSFKLLTKIEWYNNNEFQASDSFSYDDTDKITGYTISFPNNASISSDNIYQRDKLVRTNEFVNGSSSVSKYFTYEYNGDNLVKTSVFENNNLISEEVFTYAGNELTHSQKTTYNSANTTTIEAFDFVYNATQNTVTKTNSNNTANYIVTFFDTKHHPFSDTVHILPVIRSEGNKNYNNPVEIKHYINNTLSKTLTIVNEYDDYTFLTKSTRTDSSNSDVFEVHYTYNK